MVFQYKSVKHTEDVPYVKAHRNNRKCLHPELNIDKDYGERDFEECDRFQLLISYMVFQYKSVKHKEDVPYVKSHRNNRKCLHPELNIDKDYGERDFEECDLLYIYC